MYDYGYAHRVMIMVFERMSALITVLAEDVERVADVTDRMTGKRLPSVRVPSVLTPQESSCNPSFTFT